MYTANAVLNQLKAVINVRFIQDDHALHSHAFFYLQHRRIFCVNLLQ